MKNKMILGKSGASMNITFNEILESIPPEKRKDMIFIDPESIQQNSLNVLADFNILIDELIHQLK